MLIIFTTLMTAKERAMISLTAKTLPRDADQESYQISKYLENMIDVVQATARKTGEIRIRGARP